MLLLLCCLLYVIFTTYDFMRIGNNRQMSSFKNPYEDLSKFKIDEIPDSILYIPNFVSESEEKLLLDHVFSSPKPKWTQLSNRRLQNWGGLPHPKGMVAEEIPPWLKLYCDKISDLGVFQGNKANHVLVNEYLSGQGIMPHEDGPLFYPTVTTISLGSSTVLDFYHRLKEDSSESEKLEKESTKLEDRYLTSIFLEPRSLVVVKDDMYKTYLHGIKEQCEDKVSGTIANRKQCKGLNIGDVIPRTTRVSLTIRVVPKVFKTKLFFGNKK